MVRVRIDAEQHRKWLRKGMLEYLKRRMLSIKPKLKSSMLAESFDFFASSSSYPLISGGLSLALSRPFKLKELYSLSYGETIATLASSAFAQKFFSPQAREEELKFISMSSKPVSVEAVFSRAPSIARMDFSSITPPLGPRAPLKKIIEQESPSIPRKVYSLYEEKLKARIALEELYSRNYDTYYLTKLLSAGILGENKKFVPTRWAITAVDSTLSKFNISIIRDYDSINRIELYFAEHFDNKFIVLLLPGTFEFENFEAWAPSTTWASSSSFYITEEYENLKGRRSYPYSQAGAYFAVRFSVTEFLRKRRRQARIIVFREVDSGYQVPLGVWHVRETVNNALSNEALVFNDMDEVKKKLSELLTLPLPLYLKKSKILGQKRITDY